MDLDAVREAYDTLVRRGQPGAGPDLLVERESRVVRVVSDGWAGVVWTDLDEQTADAAIAAQISRFAGRPGPWEWKHHSYDTPADLPARLRAAGFAAEPEETVMVAEIAALALDDPPPDGIRLVPVVDAGGVAALVRLHGVAFGNDYSAIGAELLARLAREPGTAVGVLALAGDEPVGGGRLDHHPGTPFASIWGGGTHPAWRHRGVFRAVVARRAALAAAAGHRYLQVDAAETSRPILAGLGFASLATTTPFMHPGRGQVARHGPDDRPTYHRMPGSTSDGPRHDDDGETSTSDGPCRGGDGSRPRRLPRNSAAETIRFGGTLARPRR